MCELFVDMVDSFMEDEFILMEKNKEDYKIILEELAKTAEKIKFVAWIINKYKGDDLHESLLTQEKKELLSNLQDASLPFAMALLNEFHPHHNTFEELIEYTKEYFRD